MIPLADLLEDYESTFPVRLALGIAFFVIMGAIDIALHPSSPRRAKEYGFLALAALLAIAYGVAHDHVTATISPAYFLEGKGLREDPRPFRLAVTVLAVRATYWVGLVLGAAMLIANNPRPWPRRRKPPPHLPAEGSYPGGGNPLPTHPAEGSSMPQLPYGDMARLCLRPIAAALLAAALGALLFGLDVFGLAGTARSFAGSKEAPRFLVVWGIHTGSYVGALVGGVAAVVGVVRGRKALVAEGLRSRADLAKLEA